MKRIRKKDKDLDFVPQKMVDWFDPILLIKTGIRALLTTIFGNFLDRREIESAITSPDIFPYPENRSEKEFWFDYVADVGDGFNPTYSIAKLLAEKQLVLKEGAENYELNRGRFLVLGGDQVYPLASRDNYRNRFLGPYQSALPYVENPNDIPHLYAIPGNHDWYDGLTSFIRIFCHSHWVGGWQTKQDRSYFAIRLPYNTWLWGIDIQLESRIDKPQLDYFKNISKKTSLKGHSIILCTPEPSWLYEEKNTSYKNLDYFDRKVIKESGARLVTVLAGDMHNYNRYEDPNNGKQFIVSGGGGATLFGTHFLEEKIALIDEVHTEINLKKCFPSKSDSKKSIFGVLLFPLKSWKLTFFLMAPLYLLVSWFLQVASFIPATDASENLFNKLIQQTPSFQMVPEVLNSMANVSLYSPLGTSLLAIVLIGTVFMGGLKKWYVGLLHGLLHVFMFFIGLWLAVYCIFSVLLDTSVISLEVNFSIFIFTLIMFIIAGLASTYLVAFYLLFSHLFFKMHMNEIFAAQAFQDFKNFLRLKVDEKGITIYPIGLRKVVRKWKQVKDVNRTTPLFEPDKGKRLSPELIEEPIFIPHPKK